MTVWTPRAPAADEPACWSWEIPPIRDVEPVLAAISAKHPPASDHHRDLGALRMAYYGPQVIRWQEFHAGVPLDVDDQAPQRCAICGVPAHWPRRRLVDDHCHATGQIRGRLCGGCNTRESRSDDLIDCRYRRVHPAAILHAHRMYSGFAWTRGWSWHQHGDRSRTGEWRPPTPWPPFDDVLRDLAAGVVDVPDE